MEVRAFLFFNHLIRLVLTIRLIKHGCDHENLNNLRGQKYEPTFWFHIIISIFNYFFWNDCPKINIGRCKLRFRNIFFQNTHNQYSIKTDAIFLPSKSIGLAVKCTFFYSIVDAIRNFEIVTKITLNPLDSESYKKCCVIGLHDFCGILACS